MDISPSLDGYKTDSIRYTIVLCTHWERILFDYWCFISWEDLWSYKVGYRLVTVHTHGDFIVLLNWETSPSAL